MIPHDPDAPLALRDRIGTATRLYLLRILAALRHEAFRLLILAVIIGAATGAAIVVFRETIAVLQFGLFGTGSDHLSLFAHTLPWWGVLMPPVIGGLIVGLLVRYWLEGRRPFGVADAIEASVLHGGRMSVKDGLAAAAVNACSIASGASVGREGPAVHLGAVVGGAVAARLGLAPGAGQTLLGCGVAAAVAASFNVPVAGALFAGEVVLGHYALRTFAPIVIASIVGTIVSRAWFGDYPAFAVIEHGGLSAWETPAFLGLGIAAGLAAALFIRAIGFAQQGARLVPGPQWLKPALAGLVVGLVAIRFPEILGVGYGVTEAALAATWPMWMLAAVCALKLAATALCLGFGFGGGVFSPSLVIGATLGGAYGYVVASLFPELSVGSDAYAIVGMGAVAAIVLGAPISTTLIVFEMTGDYALTMFVMLAVVVGSLVSRPICGQSFFDWQLRQRGVDIHVSLSDQVLRATHVTDVATGRAEVVDASMPVNALRTMLDWSRSGQVFVVDDDGRLIGALTRHQMCDHATADGKQPVKTAGMICDRSEPALSLDDTLETALNQFDEGGTSQMAVVVGQHDRTLAGILTERDALRAFNALLLQARRDERL